MVESGDPEGSEQAAGPPEEPTPDSRIELPYREEFGPVDRDGRFLVAARGWQWVPQELGICVMSPFPIIRYRADDHNGNWVAEPKWIVTEHSVNTSLKGIHEALEGLREQYTSDYLDAIDSEQLKARLAAYTPAALWGETDYNAPYDEGGWPIVESSVELWDLASHGFDLYEHVFPAGAKVREYMDRLAPGGLLEVTWTLAQVGRPSNIPWGLMYKKDPGVKGDPVDPLFFLGLRHRLSYQVSEAPTGPALKGLSEANRGHLFYWNGDEDDETLKASLDQHGRWKAQDGYRSFPTDIPSDDPGARADLIRFLREPSPTPMTVLYVFCQGDNREKSMELYFGPDIIIPVGELPRRPLEDQPLIFINACKSSGTDDPNYANELESRFLRRGCRGYLGTVNRVPIRMAVQFAEVFFHFFYRRVGSEPVAAGEAVAQARQFLWKEFRNLGGLYYNYVNQYKVYMASQDEVSELSIV